MKKTVIFYAVITIITAVGLSSCSRKADLYQYFVIVDSFGKEKMKKMLLYSEDGTPENKQHWWFVIKNKKDNTLGIYGDHDEVTFYDKPVPGAYSCTIDTKTAVDVSPIDTTDDKTAQQ